jgi:hypothetical protein
VNEITGLIDTGPISEDSGSDICALASAFGDTCVACPDDGAEECLELDVHSDRSPWIENLAVDKDIDPSSDPHCN